MKKTLLFLLFTTTNSLPSQAQIHKTKKLLQPGKIAQVLGALSGVTAGVHYNNNHGGLNEPPFSIINSVLFSLLGAIPGVVSGLGVEWYKEYVKNDVRLKPTAITTYFTRVAALLPLLYHGGRYIWDSNQTPSFSAMLYELDTAIVFGATGGYFFNIIWNLYELHHRPLVKSDHEYTPLRSSLLLNSLYKLKLENPDWNEKDWIAFFESSEGKCWSEEIKSSLHISSREELYSYILDIKDQVYGFIDFLEFLKKYHKSLDDNHEIKLKTKWIKTICNQLDYFLLYAAKSSN